VTSQDKTTMQLLMKAIGDLQNDSNKKNKTKVAVK